MGLDYYLEPELPPVEGDREQLQQVLSELVINAAEALGDSPGSIRVSTDVITLDADDLAEIRCASALSVGEYVMLEVTDSGPGFDVSSSATAFDPFFTTKEGHVGMGLAAVEGVARAMGGGVRAQGGAGEGATVQVILPRTKAAVTPPPPSTGVERRGTVLVAEDEAETRQQRAMAVRFTEFMRDVDAQRRTDLVNIQNGFGQLEGRTTAEAARAQEMMNYIYRVSTQQPPR